MCPKLESEAEFITEHYWGYSVGAHGGTIEYQVQHPQWRILKAEQCTVMVDMENLYGSAFAPFLEKKPISAFLAEGSAVSVSKGQSIKVF